MPDVGQVHIAHMPSDTIQQTLNEPDVDIQNDEIINSESAPQSIQCSATADDDTVDLKESNNINKRPTVDCNAFVGNAAVHGDFYQWHVDADPLDFQPSKWVKTFGTYMNGVCIKHDLAKQNLARYALQT